MKTIQIESSKYTIQYDKDKPWDFKIFQNDEDVTRELKTNAMSDIIYWLIENLEDNKELKGLTVK